MHFFTYTIPSRVLHKCFGRLTFVFAVEPSCIFNNPFQPENKRVMLFCSIFKVVETDQLLLIWACKWIDALSAGLVYPLSTVTYMKQLRSTLLYTTAIWYETSFRSYITVIKSSVIDIKVTWKTGFVKKMISSKKSDLSLHLCFEELETQQKQSNIMSKSTRSDQVLWRTCFYIEVS